MSEGELFSFILSSDFSSFRKFDTAGEYYLTYYLIPRPTVLGIIGSIIGFEKSKEKKLSWWEELKDTKIAIEPLNINPIKEMITYNNHTGAASYDKKDGKIIGRTLVIKEQILTNPKYKIYVELNEKTRKAFDLLSNNTTLFTPYLGKNEFRAEISDVKKHKFILFEGTSKIRSIYPSQLKKIETTRSSIFTGSNGEIQILESHPYTYDEYHKYLQYVFLYSSKEINTKSFESPINGEFVQVDNKDVIYLYSGKK